VSNLLLFFFKISNSCT